MKNRILLAAIAAICAATGCSKDTSGESGAEQANVGPEAGEGEEALNVPPHATVGEGEGEEALNVPPHATVGEGEGEEALNVPPHATVGEGEGEEALNVPPHATVGEGEGEGEPPAPLNCVDRDGDGYGSGADCLGSDCNDRDDEQRRGLDEADFACDGKDNDCDLEVDEGVEGCEGGDPQGPQTCGDMIRCVQRECPDQAPACLEVAAVTCSEGAAEQALEDLAAFQTCVQDNCAEVPEDEYLGCVLQQCAAELAACS